jgi:hypothetical protein
MIKLVVYVPGKADLIVAVQVSDTTGGEESSTVRPTKKLPLKYC